jgi:hypothetical protein
MALLQPYFTVTIDRFSSSECFIDFSLFSVWFFIALYYLYFFVVSSVAYLNLFVIKRLGCWLIIGSQYDHLCSLLRGGGVWMLGSTVGSY